MLNISFPLTNPYFQLHSQAFPHIFLSSLTMKYSVYLTLAPLLFVGTTLFLLLYAETGKDYTAGRKAFLPDVKLLVPKPVLVVVEPMSLQRLDEQIRDPESTIEREEEKEWIGTSGLVVESRLFEYHFPLRMKRKADHVDETEVGISEERLRDIAEAREILESMREIERTQLGRSKS